MTTAQIVQVTLPSGDLVWVRMESPGPGRDSERGIQDVALGEAAAVVHAGLLPGFTESVRGVVTSVQHALEQVRPDVMTVEFGIEITARTGKVLSVLAESGGTAHIRVTASWNPGSGPAPRPVAGGEG